MARARRAPRHELLSSHAESRDDVLHEFYLQATSQVDGLRHRRASGWGFYDGVADDDIRAAVANGVTPKNWGFSGMPPFPQLDGDDVEALIAYVRSSQRAAGLGVFDFPEPTSTDG